MRNNILNYTTLVNDLHDVLERATKAAKGRKKRNLIHELLKDHGWTTKHEECLENVKKTLYTMVPLTHPREAWDVCVYTDASQSQSGAIATQLAPGELSKPRSNQNYSPLALL